MICGDKSHRYVGLKGISFLLSRAQGSSLLCFTTSSWRNAGEKRWCRHRRELLLPHTVPPGYSQGLP